MFKKFSKQEIENNTIIENYEIKKVVVKVLDYLQIQNVNIETFFEKINSTTFIISSENSVMCNCKCNNVTRNINLNLKDLQGLFLPLVYFNVEKRKLVLDNFIIAINSKIGEEDNTIKIIHELLHLLSNSKITSTEFVTGILHYTYVIKNYKLSRTCEFSGICINEAMTELITDKIYKEVFGRKRQKVNGYYYINIMMKLFNIVLEEDIFDMYFNNNVTLFYDLVYKKIKLNKILCNNIFANIKKVNPRYVALKDKIELINQFNLVINNITSNNNIAKEKIDEIRQQMNLN